MCIYFAWHISISCIRAVRKIHCNMQNSSLIIQEFYVYLILSGYDDYYID